MTTLTLDAQLLLAEDGAAILTETGGRLTQELDQVIVPIRTNFAMTGWYFNQQGPFQDVVDFAEGRDGEPFYV